MGLKNMLQHQRGGIYNSDIKLFINFFSIFITMREILPGRCAWKIQVKLLKVTTGQSLRLHKNTFKEGQ